MLRQLAAAVVCVAALAPAGAQARPGAATTTVDDVLASCPPAAEIAAIDADISLSFESDPTAGTLVCTAAAGSANLTRLQERTYQAMRVMRATTFALPLPWTSQTPWQWFVGAIDAVRLRGDIDVSFCCDPANTVDIQTRNLSALVTTRWVDPASGTGLESLPALFVHEARHNEGKPHTCGGNDQTVSELGAWGVQYYLYLWYGLFSGSFLDAPAPNASAYRDAALASAEQTRGRICTLPSADVTVLTSSPSTAFADSPYNLLASVENRGPEAAPAVFVYGDVPADMTLVSASSPHGTCAGPTGGARGRIPCALGPLAAGESTTVTFAFHVLPAVRGYVGAAMRAVGPYRDPVPSNDSGAINSPVLSPPPPQPPCVGDAGPGGTRVVGTVGNDVIRGTRGADILCGAGGNDKVSGLAENDVVRGDAGNDLLDGGRGSDRIEGGPGNDVVVARDGTRDRVNCGPGSDRAVVDRRDAVDRTCERVLRR